MSSKPAARSRSRGVFIAAGALAAIVALRLACPAYKIPSGAMTPTLLVGDHIWARRALSAPQRGDVTIFRFPERPEQDFVMRVVGMPGERIEFIDGRPVINGWLVPRCKVGTYPYDGKRFDLYVEYLGDAVYGVLFDAIGDEVSCQVDSECKPGLACRGGICGTLQGPYQVPAGEVWVVGDNRNNSYDSRMWDGGRSRGVPFDHIRATARVRWMALAPDGSMGMERLGSIHGPPALPGPLAPALGAALEQCVRNRPAPERTAIPH